MTALVTDHERINMMRLILARQGDDQEQAALACAKIEFVQDTLTTEFTRDVYPALEMIIPDLVNSKMVAASFGNTRVEMMAANIKKGTGSILLYDISRREPASVPFTEKIGPEFAFCFTRKGAQSPITCAATSCYGTMNEFKTMIDEVAQGLHGIDNAQTLFTAVVPANA